MIGKIYYHCGRNQLIIITDRIFSRFYTADFGKKGVSLAVITPISRYEELVYIGRI